MNAEALEDLRRADDKLYTIYPALLRERSAEKEFCHNLWEAQQPGSSSWTSNCIVSFPSVKGRFPRTNMAPFFLSNGPRQNSS